MKAPNWTEAEEQRLLEIIQSMPGQPIVAIARAAAPHLRRPMAGVEHRICNVPSLRAAVVPAAKPAARARAQVSAVTINRSTPHARIASADTVSLPPLPFSLRTSERDESRPYDRRAAFGAKPVRPEESRVDWFKRILTDVAHEVRA